MWDSRKSYRWLIAAAVVCFASSVAFGQQANDVATADTTTSSAPEQLTTKILDDRQQSVEKATDLDDTIKTQTNEIYEKARQALEQEATFKDQADQYTSWVQTALDDLAKVQSDLKQPESGYDFDSIDDQTDLRQLIDDSTQLEQQLELSRQELSTIQTESGRRTERRATVAKRLADIKPAADDIQRQQAIKPQDSIGPHMAEASQSLLQAQLQAIEAERAALELELKAYDAQGTEYLQFRRELLSRSVEQQETDLAKLRAMITQRRQTDATSQLEEAKLLASRLSGDLQSDAKKLAELAQSRITLAADIEKAGATVDQLKKDLPTIRDEFLTTEQRLGLGRFSGVGLLLYRKKSDLPDEFAMRRNCFARRDAIAESQGELFALEYRQAELSKKEVRPRWALSDLLSEWEELPEEEVKKRILQSEAMLLKELIAEWDRYYDLVIQSNSAEQELITLTSKFRRLIDDNVFWVRSAPLFMPSMLQDVIPAAQWLFDPGNWSDVGQAIWRDIRQAPLTVIVFAALLVAWWMYRGRCREQLVELGEVARRRSCREFQPTAHALLLTVLLAVGGPLVAYFLAWRLGLSASTFAHSLSERLADLAFFYLVFAIMRQTMRPNGLAEAHFGTASDDAKRLRRCFGQLIVFVLPLMFVTMTLAAQPTAAFSFSLGRICFVVAVVAMVVALRPMFAKTTQTSLGQHLMMTDWSSYPLYPSLVVLAAGVIIAALTGYYFTATSLLKTFVGLFALACGLWLLGSLLSRLLRVERRALAYRQAVERRQRDREADGKEAGELEELMIEDEEIDVRQVDDQSRRLVRNLLLIVGFFGAMWALHGSLPALSILNRMKLWQTQNIEGTLEWVTAADLGLAIVVFAATGTLAKNLHGLLEMLVFKRLNLESSVRYAISQLSVYAVVAVGLVIGCNLLGFTWRKMQWLVAALGVGLGFGLQEIFANFVAGIILLFERPIRVGDVITLGDKSGVVTQIHIRATTIRNWDRQDLIVPNRDLITGQLLNWSLSGGLNRISFTVGVAYGTDVRTVRELLLKILADHPKVLDQPKPLVTFENFGDSSLNVVVRACLAEIDDRLSTTNELHTVIHEEFGKAGIEIPFPQRDLHVKSVDDVIRTADRTNSLEGLE